MCPAALTGIYAGAISYVLAPAFTSGGFDAASIISLFGSLPMWWVLSLSSRSDHPVSVSDLRWTVAAVPAPQGKDLGKDDRRSSLLVPHLERDAPPVVGHGIPWVSSARVWRGATTPDQRADSLAHWQCST